MKIFPNSTRRWFLTIPVIALGLMILRSLVFGPSPIDLLYASILDHDTVYAEGFSQQRWRVLALGVSSHDVEASIGQPLRKTRLSRGREVWHYSVSPGDTHYWRKIAVLQGGRLVQLQDFFYFD